MHGDRLDVAAELVAIAVDRLALQHRLDEPAPGVLADGDVRRAQQKGVGVLVVDDLVEELDQRELDRIVLDVHAPALAGLELLGIRQHRRERRLRCGLKAFPQRCAGGREGDVGGRRVLQETVAHFAHPGV